MLVAASSTLAAPVADAEKTRAEISSIESVLPKLADRGAGLFLLARKYAHVGDQAKALELLKECLSLEAGFDPSDSPSLQPLRSHPEFVAMVERAARQYPPVHHATVAFDIPATDLFPEGLAVDAANGTFYMGSMHHKKIVSFILSGPVTTDTEGNHVYRFDRHTHAFTRLQLFRPVFYPNGITVSGDGRLLFVADMLGVIRVDLQTNESQDVDPGPHDTLSGIDGLYWYRGGLLGVQYGTGKYRVKRWWLSPDQRRVTRGELLEYRTPLVDDPTTGAIYHDVFYFIANTGIDNLEDDKISDPDKLAPVHIASVPLTALPAAGRAQP